MIIILLLFFIPFLLEGAGVPFVRPNLPHLYLLLPAILYLYTLIKKKILILPRRASFFFGLFLFFSLVSAIFFSVDKQVSFERFLFYLASFFIFIFFYNYQEEGKKIVRTIIIFAGLFFIFYFLAVRPSYLSHGYQLVFSYFGSHNHLGDLLGAAIIVSRFFFLSLPLFLLSFSRSAYLSLLLVGGIYLLVGDWKGKRKLFFKGALILVGISIFLFFLLTAKEAKESPIFKGAYDYLAKTFNLQSKDFLANRLEYVNQGLQSFYQRPFFGVGPGNFGYASKEYAATPFEFTEAAHNLFFEILVENGLFAFFGFLVFIILILRCFLKPSFTFHPLFFYLLLNFQTDYTYRIYSFFLLFIIVTAVVYREEKHWPGQFLLTLISLAPLFILVLILTSHNLRSPYFYPFNKQLYPALIEEEQQKGNYANAVALLNLYQYVAPYDLAILQFSADFYENYQEKNKAVQFYQKAYQVDGYVDFSVIKKIYLLKKELEGSQKAASFFEGVLENYNKIRWVSKTFNRQVINFCHRENEAVCKKKNWW